MWELVYHLPMDGGVKCGHFSTNTYFYNLDFILCRRSRPVFGHKPTRAMIVLLAAALAGSSGVLELLSSGLEPQSPQKLKNSGEVKQPLPE